MNDWVLITAYLAGYLIMVAGMFHTQVKPRQENAVLALCLFWPILLLCIAFWLFVARVLRPLILWLTHPDY